MILYFSSHLISLGFLKIQTWGLLVALGIVVSLLILYRISKTTRLSWDKVLGLVLGIMIFAFLFARLFHVIWGESLSYFKLNFWNIFAIYDGGFASTGGFFGAGLYLFLFYKKNKNVFWQYANALAYAFPFGWIIGRIGCFLIHDHPGILTDSFLAVNFPNTPRFDMAFLEILAILPLLIIFLLASQKERFCGFYPSVLLIWYGISRFFLDFLRAVDLPFSDPRYSGLTIAQWSSILLVVIGCAILLRSKKVKVNP